MVQKGPLEPTEGWSYTPLYILPTISCLVKQYFSPHHQRGSWAEEENWAEGGAQQLELGRGGAKLRELGSGGELGRGGRAGQRGHCHCCGKDHCVREREETIVVGGTEWFREKIRLAAGWEVVRVWERLGAVQPTIGWERG